MNISEFERQHLESGKPGPWPGFITGEMDADDPDSILYAIYVTDLNGRLCDVDNPDKCKPCYAIWEAIGYRLGMEGLAKGIKIPEEAGPFGF